jgi:4-hydroxy-tetrahydrodipicolinate synthase
MRSLSEIRGCGTALVTPFRADGNLDEKALLGLVDFQLREGIDFLVPCGSTGESAVLSQEEHDRVVELVVQRVRGKVPVMAGAGGNHTQKVVERAARMEALGADAVISVTPYYNRPNQEGLYQHFKAVAEAVRIPVVVYNVPVRTGANLLPETLKRLSTIKNIIGVKEASGNMAQITEIAMTCPTSFNLISGDDANTLPIIALGGTGLISVVSNEVPKEATRFTRLCLDGKWKEAAALQRRLYRLMQLNFIDTSPVPVKAALAKMGLIEEHVRLPLVPLSNADKQKLVSALRELGLISSIKGKDAEAE